jgi:cytochrome c556
MLDRRSHSSLPAAMVHRCASPLLAGLAGLLLAAAPPAPAEPPLSRLAPADDLIGQVQFYFDRVQTALADPRRYHEAQQARVQKDALVLSALAQALARHDQPHRWTAAAGALLAAAEELAAGHAHYDRARPAADRLARALEGHAGDPPPDRWRPVGPLGPLMKHVGFVHQQMQRALRGESPEAAAGPVATLVALAAVLAEDPSPDRPADQHRAWREISAQLRDAAGQLNQALHSGDAPQRQQARRALDRSCQQCHDQFRP